MATEKLFGNQVTPMCQYCNEAVQKVGENMLCLKKGIVPSDFSCKRFEYDPLKRVPQRPRPLDIFSEEDFTISTLEGEP